MKTSLRDLAAYLTYTRECAERGDEAVSIDEYFDGGN
jgi:hypothetical protein